MQSRTHILIKWMVVVGGLALTVVSGIIICQDDVPVKFPFMVSGLIGASCFVLGFFEE